MLRRHDRWIWDSWPVTDGADRHLFHLQAPRSPAGPAARHRHATVGHAVSPDWEHWTVLPDALTAAPAPAWDDLAIWTGSVVRGPAGRWHLFYTGLSHADDGRVQRIGRADSDDLVTWHRAGTGPAVSADPRWYETLDRTDWAEETWRDPWVLRDPGGDGWHMLITARLDHGPRFDRGVLGHARSADLDRWTVLPPLTAPAGFGQLEVAQVTVLDGRPVLTFCCLAPELAAGRRAVTPETGMWSAPGASPLGPFDLAAARPFEDPSLYAAHLVETVDGRPALLGFTRHPFDGAIPAPVRVRLHRDGTLRR